MTCPVSFFLSEKAAGLAKVFDLCALRLPQVNAFGLVQVYDLLGHILL